MAYPLIQKKLYHWNIILSISNTFIKQEFDNQLFDLYIEKKTYSHVFLETKFLKRFKKKYNIIIYNNISLTYNSSKMSKSTIRNLLVASINDISFADNASENA